MKISVVIPTLNSERTIKLAANSSLKVADEVIVVDFFPRIKLQRLQKKKVQEFFK
jgi:glycosyltransferase involved in cell wall biosynthesis